MSVKDYREKNEQELNETLDALRNELKNYAMDVTKGKEKNSSKLSLSRREIARVLTVLNEKKIISTMEDPNA
jgi:large subunit ribosomal protein L29